MGAHIWAPEIHFTHGTTVAAAAHPGMSSTELARNTPAALRLPVRPGQHPVPAGPSGVR